MGVSATLNVEKLEQLTDQMEFIMWGIEGNYHYILNRCYAFRITLGQMKNEEDAWELYEFLKEKFGREPKPGQTLCYNYGHITDDKHQAKTVVEKYMPEKLPEPNGETTPYLYAVNVWRNRLIKFNDHNVFVNDDFLSLLYETVGLKAYSPGLSQPVYLLDGDFMILPIKDFHENVTNAEMEEFAEIVAANAAIARQHMLSEAAAESGITP